jgi:hypothetical protein
VRSFTSYRRTRRRTLRSASTSASGAALSLFRSSRAGSRSQGKGICRFCCGSQHRVKSGRQPSAEYKRLGLSPPATRYSASKKGDKLSATFAVPNYFNMSIPKPTVANAREIVLPDSMQLLLVVLLLALLFCIPIVVLTNHVKRAAAILASVPYSQSLAAETIPQPDIQGLGALEAAAPIAQPQRDGVAITPQETEITNRILTTLSQTRAIRGRRMSSTLSRTWFRTNSPRNVTAALITISHQHSKRRQKHR